ncbi:MAG: class I SAM-dependent methyltransferase [Verrucomicrobiota bacterium]|nr:class I SAM-dependent methyltransferase [Verrucomicrobiota bacterium]
MGLHRFARAWRQWWSSRRTSDESAAALERWQGIGKKVRAFAAYRYIRGSGIEIGALDSPLQTYHRARVRYLDCLPSEKLRAAYPEIPPQSVLEVEQVEDGETLGSVPNESCDFVIANHVLEHLRNPIRGMENMFRVLKSDGILYLALPDKRFTFDVGRSVTSYEHLKRDYLDGPDWSDAEHSRDWIKFVGKVNDESEIERRANLIRESRSKIHFHVWTQREFVELLMHLRRDFNFPIEIEALIKNGLEFVVVLRKADLG